MLCILCNVQTNRVLASKIRSGEARKVFYCEKCDMGFIGDSRTNKELEDFYKENYRKKAKPKLHVDTNPKDLFDSYVDFQSDRMKIIGPYLGKDKKLLEIGCSAGMFLYNVKDHLAEVIGIDFDVKSVAYASNKCGCKVYNCNIGETSLQKKSFDIICAFQMLEHVKDPKTFLSQIKEYLKDDGIIYVEVPNIKDSLVSTCDLPHYQQFYYHSSHLYYFSRKSLNLLTQSLDLSAEFYFTQDYNIFNHINWILNDMPQSSCIPGLSKPSVKFRDHANREEQEKLSFFFEKIDIEYKQLLRELQITSNISFVARKNR